MQRKYIAIVEQKSISKAATLLHISQPALTIALQKHEKELGIALVERGTGSLVITPAGLAVYEAYCAQQTLNLNLLSQLQLLRGQKPAFALGMIDGVASLLADMPELLTNLEEVVQLRLVIDNSRVLSKAVHDRTIDAALITADQPASDVHAEFLANETMVLVAHPAQVDGVTAELMGGVLTSCITYDAPSATHRLITAHLAKLGVTIVPELSSTSTDVMTRLVRGGRGSACVPFHAVRADVRAGRLRLVTYHDEVIMITRPIYIVTQNHYHMPASVRDFLKKLAAIFAAQPEAI